LAQDGTSAKHFKEFKPSGDAMLPLHAILLVLVFQSFADRPVFSFDCGQYHHLKLHNRTLTLHNGPGNPDFEWGNFLTVYWNARGIAKLAGVCFENLLSPGGEIKWWFKYLPQHVCPPERIDDLFDRRKLKTSLLHARALAKTCGRCRSTWRYPHECRGPWSFMLAEAQQETQQALRRWASENGLPLPAVKPNTAVIYLRCTSSKGPLGDAFILGHPSYGPPAFSLYENIASASEIVITSSSYALSGICLTIRKALLQRLHVLTHKEIVIREQYDGSIFFDFATLVFAPMLFTDISTFALVAGMANNSSVYSTPFWPQKISFPGAAWTWASSPVLYPHVAAEHKIASDEEILKFLTEH
jgi:hypothetical protein